MRFHLLRRHIIILAFTVSSALALALAGVARAQVSPLDLTWEELAAHAGLAGIKPKMRDLFKADVVFEQGKNISALKASIQLSPEEWAWLSSNKPPHLLHPWYTNAMSDEIWKGTVDLGLPTELLPNRQTTVKVDKLNFNDPAVILRRPDSRSVRVYLLSADPGGKSGVLFYFFRDNL